MNQTTPLFGLQMWRFSDPFERWTVVVWLRGWPDSPLHSSEQPECFAHFGFN